MGLRLFSFFLAIYLTSCQDYTTESQSELHESHPFVSNLRCDRARSSELRGILYDTSKTSERKIGEFIAGHLGSCELALRASRQDQVCIEKNYSYVAVKISTLETLKNFGKNFQACLQYTRGWDHLETQKHFVEFIHSDELRKITKNLPQLADQEFNDALHSSRAIWYDEASMVFVYQDSFGDPKGLRANRVGYDTGFNNTTPDIRLLTEYFKHGKFKFPFSITAGVDFHDNDHALYFWLPPEKNGSTLPVKYWKNNSHFHWTFPIGTIFGEVLTVQAPDDKEWYTFEIRIRKRERDAWKTFIYRPFLSATEMAQAIRQERPLGSTSDLKNLVAHLESEASLTAKTLKTEKYSKIVPDFNGALDYLPATKDYELIKNFLRNRTFKDAMGSSWKKNDKLETFAASTQADFHIVAKNYIGGMFATTEASCKTCHEHTGHPVGNLDRRIVLYGEIWGEDQIFTWHPFAIATDSFTVSDNSRRINQRLVTAGLLKLEKPSAQDPNYKVLPLPYRPIYE